MHHPDNGLELYFGKLTSRFAVFTANTIENLPLMDCTAAIQDTLERYMRKKPAAQSPLDKKADDTIAKLRSQKNGNYFSELFDFGLVNGTSHSEADAALCALIAFRTGDDPELIDAIFRKSALYPHDSHSTSKVRYHALEHYAPTHSCNFGQTVTLIRNFERIIACCFEILVHSTTALQS